MSKKSENFSFKLVLDSMEDGVYIVDKKHKIHFINSQLENEFGPLEGKKCFEYFHERTDPCPWCKNEEVFIGNTVRWEWTSPKNQKTYDLIDSPLYTSDGKIFKLEIFRDITGRRKIEKKLSESEDRFQNIVLKMPVLVNAVDDKGRFIFWNKECERVTGYTKEEIVGRSDANSLLYPDSEYLSIILQEWTAKGDNFHNWEIQLTRKDGTKRTISWSNISEHVTIPGWRSWAIGVDISERKLAQENLKNRERQSRTLSYLAQKAISERDLDVLMDNVVVTVAECLDVELCKILELVSDGKKLLLKSGIGWKEGYTGSAKVDTGIESQAGYTLLSKEPVIVVDLRSETRFSGPQLLTDHGVISGMSVIISGQEGHYGILGAHTKVRRIFSEDDVAFFQSVADILALAIERRKTEIERQKLQKKREQFLTLTTHELRTPMTIFRGYVEYLQAMGEDIAEEKRRYCLEEMHRNCDRLENLISNAADISKIDREIFKISPITFKLNDFLDEVKNSLKLTLKGEIDYHMNEEDIKITIGGDPNRLKQIIENLVQNAVNHTYKDTRNIILKVEVCSNVIKIIVSDNGVGILKENLERIFEQFVSISSDLYVGGSGVGLYISRMIAEAHTGTLVAESDGLGKGSRFILEFPKVKFDS